MPVTIPKKDKELIDKLALTDSVRELARVMLAYMSVEQAAKYIGTLMVFRARGGHDEEALNYFIKDQFLALLKIMSLSMTDLLPDLIKDFEFMKLTNTLYGPKFQLNKLFNFVKRNKRRKRH